MIAHLNPRVLALSTLFLFTQQYAKAVWITPYAADSTPDQILRYVGTQGSVTAPDADGTFAGVTYNNNPAVGSAAGASLFVQGSTAFSALGVIVAKTNSQVSAGGATPGLRFNTLTDGLLGDLVSATPAITWRGTSEVIGSDVWDSFGSTSYRYVFDLQLNNSLLGGLGVNLFNGVSLTISAGGNTLYSASGLTTILGLPNIVNTNYNDVTINFEYDQSMGPIVIKWESSSLVSGNLLSGLGTGVANVFTFSDARIQVDAIPEPTSLAILSGAGVLYTLRFRRRSRA